MTAFDIVDGGSSTHRWRWMKAIFPMSVSLRVVGFAPLTAPDARILVLGSMPGVASLRQQQYYAHPRNAFWPIAAEVCGFEVQASYEARCAALMASRIALWDVLQACVRPGSLDASIDITSIVPNDFQAFLDNHPSIARICFNGAKAAAMYRRHVLPTLTTRDLRYVDLPSTSPAHAAMTRQDKLRAWGYALALPDG